MSKQPPPPTPILFFETVSAFHQTAALKAAVELDLFTAIGHGNKTPADLARVCGAAERGVRILCDYLTICGFLTKAHGTYTLTADSAAFLSSSSPRCLTGALEFMLSATVMQSFAGLTEAVRKGGTVLPNSGTIGESHPVWVQFARAMGAVQAPVASLLAARIAADFSGPIRVLDVAAGHGIFGITVAQTNPQAAVTVQDWEPVLEVARDNAARMGVTDQCTLLPGDMFNVEFGGPYNVILLTNIAHHFDTETCIGLLRKVRKALADGGAVYMLEFVPNDDRVSPPNAAGFALTMLATTPHGDAYTFAEYDGMLRSAGITRSELVQLKPMPNQVIVSRV